MPYKVYPYKITKKAGEKFWWTDYTLKRKEREVRSLYAEARRLLTARYNYDIGKLTRPQLNKKYGYDFKKTDSKAKIIRTLSKHMDMLASIGSYIDDEMRKEKALKKSIRSQSIKKRIRTRRI